MVYFKNIILNVANEPFLHFQGCFARLLDFINMHLNTLIGLGLAVGFLQVRILNLFHGVPLPNLKGKNCKIHL